MSETKTKRRRPRPPVVIPADLRELPHACTVDEVAAVLRTSRKAVYSRIERGLMPGVVRDGRRVLVLRDDLLSFLSERRAASPGDR